MNKEQFDAACVAAFGTNYTSDIARALNVTSRTIRYWRDGAREIPDAVTEDFIHLLNTRKLGAEYAINKLRALTFKDMLMKEILKGDKDYDHAKINDPRGHLNFLTQAVMNEKFISLIEKLDDAIKYEDAISSLRHLKKMADDGEITIGDLFKNSLSERKMLANALIINKYNSRTAITAAFNVTYDEIFPPFVFDAEPGLFGHVQSGMMVEIQTTSKVDGAYRVSKSAASFKNAEVFQISNERMALWSSMNITTQLDTGEIVWVSCDEAREYNLSECPIKPIDFSSQGN